jgi:nitrite reductase/ring-hydroxylating ferredoxin subunit
MNRTSIFKHSDLADRKPEYAIVGEVDLVVMRFDDEVSVFYGRCFDRGALMSDGHVRGNDLICGVHNWDYRLDSGVSAYANDEKLPKFTSWLEGDDLCVDADEINAWGLANLQPYNRDAYLGLYADPSHGADAEPYNGLIQGYAKAGLSKTGHYGVVESMGVPRHELPDWDDIQLLTAQLYKPPLLDDDAVGTEVVIGPNAQKPLKLKIPLFVSDMSFGALSESAKVALARGAELVGTGICSGEGGMLPEEQAEIFRDNISVPTIPALARARRHLDKLGRSDVTLVITGGLRKPADFIKAMAMGADAIAVSNSAMQTIGCLAMRACHTNNCPVGIATQKPHLVNRLVAEKSARQLAIFFEASVGLMQVMARACGNDHLSKFNADDLTTWKKDIAPISGVNFGGVA